MFAFLKENFCLFGSVFMFIFFKGPLKIAGASGVELDPCSKGCPRHIQYVCGADGTVSWVAVSWLGCVAWVRVFKAGFVGVGMVWSGYVG